ncbi:hypothetical protein OPKNFCMD_4008 [Methylobacterium crusticola]|uniref:DUF3828 domain-containing protein n=1 Tax=Methylobacterium crusticola TaxID=1697972 RepID=A0ABQ4R0P8_9HYPH|nr:hypothetical protein [Methylobacterium crusticola]GJD51255.1 hypothetical protein OPKNFCMD_4008 [Methylobacterium crusticola]
MLGIDMTRAAWSGILIAGLAALPSPLAAAQARAPLERVRSAYRQIEAGTPQNGLDGAISPEFRRIYAKDRSCENRIKDQHFASSMFVSGQDIKVTDVSASVVDSGGGEQRVTVRFRQFGQPDGRTFVFVKNGADWALDDVVFGGRSLRSAMSEPCPRA